jgi:hypothetical protein
MDAYQLYRNQDGSADSDFAVKFRTIAQIQQVNDVQLAAATPTDSYREFLGGLYRMIKDRHYRTMGSAEFGNEYRSPITGRILGYRPNNPGFPNTPVRTDT